jgi:cytosine/adenosine deaminase-related metal-dependent hydrolase
MKYYSAAHIHDGRDWVADPELVLAFDEDNIFTGYVSRSGLDPDQVQELDGILCPGFVNAHCHLELSHTKGVIPEHTGLVTFLGKVVFNRATDEQSKLQAIEIAMAALEASGCIAVGDIANTEDLLHLRLQGNMHVHTFVETMGFIPQTAAQRMTFPEQVYRSYAAQTSHPKGYVLRQSIVPHAPYSVSDKLFELIDDFEPGSLLSIHNEETPAENQYFIEKTGEMKELYKTLNIDDTYFQPSGKTSLQTYLPYIKQPHDLLLVHNTCITNEDLAYLHQYNGHVSLCLCPNANWYIERALPDIPAMKASGHNICLGTDSLASNHDLNIYGEIQKIKEHYPQIALSELLSWATMGGARALQLDHIIGSFEPGKRPGLVQIHEEVSKRIM